jgi:hypothetical protein
MIIRTFRFRTLSLAAVGVGGIIALSLVLTLPITPMSPLADASGSCRTLAVSEPVAITAITNALDCAHYNEMLLVPITDGDWIEDNWHPTNGFVLMPTPMSSFPKVPCKGLLGVRTLAYTACFHVFTKPVAQDRTEIVVRTVRPRIIVGKTVSGHGALAHRTRPISAIRQEEDNILTAICNQLLSNEALPMEAATNRVK